MTYDHEIVNILRDAHIRMDRLGYPPRPSATAPIDDRTNDERAA